MIRRREFITLIGGAAAAWPLTVHAQRTGKLPTIGLLGVASPSTWKPWVAAFVQRLRELGWVEGQTIAIEYRWAEGRSERFDEIIATSTGREKWPRRNWPAFTRALSGRKPSAGAGQNSPLGRTAPDRCSPP